MKGHTQRIKSVSEQVRWQMSLLGMGFFFASLLLASLFSFRAVETTTKSLVKLEAESIVRHALQHPELPLPHSEMEAAYKHWEEIPIMIRRLFSRTSPNMPPPNQGTILEATRNNEQGQLEYFYLLHHVDKQFGNLFLLSRHNANDIETTTLGLFKATLLQSLWWTLSIFCLLFLLIFWLIRRTSEPLVMLSEWAENLGKNPTLPLKTDFPIRELNALAQQLRAGVDKIETYNRREQEFLRYASHELRTPLGIIQASLDTLALQAGPQQNKPVLRALKASQQVRQLCAALLWLARESNTPIEKSIVEVKPLVTQLIADHKHLLTQPESRISLACHIDNIAIEEEVFTIVLSNLIRNAFQHSSEGSIDIFINTNQFKISNIPQNTLAAATNPTLCPSFGLGLQLVQRICQKLGWQFHIQEGSSQISCSINWTAQ